jgi:flavin prenyltransferase
LRYYLESDTKSARPKAENLLKRIIIGITGASGIIYGVRLLEVLSGMPEIETHLVLTKPAQTVLRLETSLEVTYVIERANRVYSPNDIAAPIASGSFLCDAMAVGPCSMKTLSMISLSLNENLLVRAADVMLKERRKLVLVPRETPLHLGHLRAMTAITEMGGIVLPPTPGFYTRPRTVEDIVDHTVGKVLDQLGVSHELFVRWGNDGS